MSGQCNIDGRTRLMGLIGQGIDYTLSPLMHNFAARKLGLNVAYLPIDLAQASLRYFLDLAWDMGGVGFNVTTPHKFVLASLLNQPELQSINVLKRGQTWWEPASTDGPGFVRGLGHMNYNLTDFSSFIVLGNGGAVAALVPYLKDRPVFVLRRNPARDSDLYQPGMSFLPFAAPSLRLAIKEAGDRPLLIQATNYRQAGVNLEQFINEMDCFRGAICDLVYNSSSCLLEYAKDHGIPAQDGLPMLIEQARLSQEFWWGSSLSYDELLNVIK